MLTAREQQRLGGQRLSRVPTYCSFGSSTQPPVRLLWPPPGTSRRYDQNTRTSESRNASASPSTYSFSGTRARSRRPATSVVSGDSTGSLTGLGKGRAAVPWESVVTATICRFGKAPQGRASRGTSRRLGFFNTRLNSRESRAHRRAVTSTDTEAGSAPSADTQLRTVAPVANVSTCDRTVNLQLTAARHRARTCEGRAPRPRFRRATMPLSTTNRPLSVHVLGRRRDSSGHVNHWHHPLRHSVYPPPERIALAPSTRLLTTSGIIGTTAARSPVPSAPCCPSTSFVVAWPTPRDLLRSPLRDSGLSFAAAPRAERRLYRGDGGDRRSARCLAGGFAAR